MRKKQQRAYSKECLKPLRLLNWIRCDCCSTHINCVNITPSDSKKMQWFQGPMCVNVVVVEQDLGLLSHGFAPKM